MKALSSFVVLTGLSGAFGSNSFLPKRMSVRATTAARAVDIQQQAPLLEVRGGAKKDEVAVTGGKASIPASVFNLVNNVAGAGILTLSAGMASGTGWVPAIVVCTVLGLLSAHTFSIIGEACELTGEMDFKVSTSNDHVSPFVACVFSCYLYTGYNHRVSGLEP
jgi:hypothetical protein